MTAAPRPIAKHRRRPPLLIGLVTLAIVTAGYFGWQHFAQRPHVAPQPPRSVPVITTTVKQQNFPIVLTGIGNVTALNSATVRSMVTEQIISIDFKDGQFVKKGQLLAQLDPSSLQAQLAQAEANLARDQTHAKCATQFEPVCPVGKGRLCTGAAGRDSAGDDRPTGPAPVHRCRGRSQSCRSTHGGCAHRRRCVRHGAARRRRRGARAGGRRPFITR